MVNSFFLQGIIATKLMQERTCYISAMNRNEMPSFENLAQLASQNMVRFKISSSFECLNVLR